MILRGGAGLIVAFALIFVFLVPVPSIVAQAACNDFTDGATDAVRAPNNAIAPADQISHLDRAELTGGCLTETATAIEVQINTARAPGAGTQESYTYTLVFKNASATLSYQFKDAVATPAGTAAISGTGVKFTIDKAALALTPGERLFDFAATGFAQFVTPQAVFTASDRAPDGTAFVFPSSAPYVVGSRAPDDLDFDGDGVSDRTELANGTNPSSPDSDHDGLLDGAGTDLAADSPEAANLTALGIYQTNNDGTTITFAGEADYGTNNTRPDTDGDGLTDGGNVRVPTGGEVSTYFSNFTLAPYSNDGTQDLFLGELDYGADPLNPDSDADGIMDREEVTGSENPGYPDDGFFPEFPGSTDPNTADSDADGLSDAEEVSGAATSDEGVDATFAPLDPNDNDTDRDGLSDYDEVFGHTEIDGEEIHFTPTDPTLQDTDGDGTTDYDEVRGGTDPRDANDKPGQGGDDAPGGAEASYLALSTIAMLVVILLCIIGILVRWG